MHPLCIAAVELVISRKCIFKFSKENIIFKFKHEKRLNKHLPTCGYYFAMTPSCLPSTELAKYAKTKLVLNIGNSDLRCMLKVIIKYGKFKLLFLRGLHGIVLKCLHREHIYLSSFNQ